jgi:hypothetical protein
MRLEEIRRTSLTEAKRLGYATNPALPLLDANLALRSQDDIVSRALALHCVVASSYGFPSHRSLEWLRQEKLLDALSAEENAFLNGSARQATQFQIQGECLWIFAWSLRKVEYLDFARPAGDSLVGLYPDLKKSESSAQWQTAISLRSVDEVVAACDLAYCLHWAINQSRLDPRTEVRSVKPYVIVERRRALEWLLVREQWSDIEFDT